MAPALWQVVALYHYARALPNLVRGDLTEPPPPRPSPL